MPSGPPLSDVLANYCDVMRPRLRSLPHRQSAFTRHVLPSLGEIAITDLRRSQIMLMLDSVEASAGPVMADRTLAYLRAALNWYAVRSDDFQPPFARGMTRATGRERTRVLSDLELRRIWLHTEGHGPFERFVRVSLLTGQRRSEVARMAWTEIEHMPNGMLWRIPRERFKSGMEHVLPLPDSIAPLLGERGKLGPYVFSHDDGLGPINAFGRPLARLRTRSSTYGWVLHDLRRTCRTRLAGLGVADPVADLILGHGKRGLARVYNQHRYEGEMRNALELWIASATRLVHSLV